MQLHNPTLLCDQCLINGEWRDAVSGQQRAVINPATGIMLAKVPTMGQTETSQAIEAAQNAQRPWQQLTAQQRSAFLLTWADNILIAQEDLAQIITAEQGKPLREARNEVVYAASFITWFAEEAKRIDGAVLQTTQETQRLLVLKQPVGVCAAITPWNFPAAMITRKVAPALAAGCTIIVKPAKQTPLTALALGKLAQKAGIPAGVLQVITGEAAEIGKVLCDSPVVRKLSFTGSTEVGRLLMSWCAPSIKKLSLELGGNAPMIIFADANLDNAVAGIMAAKFRNSGQTCICANRIYVQSTLYVPLVEKLRLAIEQLQVGDGTAAGTTQGPLIDTAAVEKVQSHIADAVQKGAKIATGGQLHTLGGTFFQPTLLTGATQQMKIVKEETFGPVAPLIGFSDETEAIALANDTEFGLAAYLFTENTARQWRVSEALEYGMVGINTAAISNEVAPFGGVKQSGLGREGSRYGIDEYLELKYLCVDITS